MTIKYQYQQVTKALYPRLYEIGLASLNASEAGPYDEPDWFPLPFMFFPELMEKTLAEIPADAWPEICLEIGQGDGFEDADIDAWAAWIAKGA